MSLIDDVALFHSQVLGVEAPQVPTVGTLEWQEERYRFMQEELGEYFRAAREGDIVGATDGLLDLVYVALGTLHQMGVPTQRCWDAVQRSNMTKVRGMTKRGNAIDAYKPKDWVGPEAMIAHILERKANESTD